MTTNTARRLQTRLAHAETTRRDALAAWHKRCCLRLGLPLTATDYQINDAFARRIAGTIHRYEREHGLLPALRPVALNEDRDALDALDDVTCLARAKATLLQDGYLAYKQSDAGPPALTPPPYEGGGREGVTP